MAMNTATFTDKNTYADFGLILAHKEIGEAEVRTNYIDVPARDGLLDATEAFGEVKYKNRPLTIVLQYIGEDRNWAATLSAFTNYVHGKTHKIYLEREYYWYGRCKVKAASSEKGIRIITVECDCEPYKYKLQPTIVSVAVSGTKAITLTNSRRRVVPEVKVTSTGTLNIVYGDGNIWDLGSGSYTLPELELVEGENIVTVIGTGTVTFTWREGDL